jgi:putative pre-16S rRNA nuclease
MVRVQDCRLCRASIGVLQVKYMALDVGDRRVGAAVGDSDLRIATPIDVIERKSPEQDARIFGELASKYGVGRLIVGLPRNMDETVGPQAESVRAYGEKIAQWLNLPLTLWDERLTTIDAAARLASSGAHGKRSRRTLDAIAASVILQDYMDSQEKALE